MYFISILPDDYYTDEEEMEGTIITAEMVRVWEKEDEEERKTKKSLDNKGKSHEKRQRSNQGIEK
jgi:hypothetical protein